MSNKDIKISLCYIVKNEEKNIPISLATVRDVADELVVVDTGSSDHTKEVAQRYGAKIYDYIWQNDFAAARNFALEKSTGDWIIFLDADEYFRADTAKDLRSLIKAQESAVNLLLIQRQDVNDEGEVLLSLYVPRIFRRRSDLRYEGAIHEELRQNGQLVTGVVAVLPDQLQLIHTGYAGNLGRAKAQRNLNILLQELSKASQPGRLYGYLAEAYDGMDDVENAMKYAYMDIARGRQAETYASRSYRLLLEKLSIHKRDYRERQRVGKMAVQEYPELPEFHAEYAESLAAGWEYAEAAEEMAQAIILGRDYQGMEPTVFTQELGATWQKRRQYFAKMAAEAENIKVSACVITKNEAKNIGLWLENARIYADECIVLDTGSTDSTCELAAHGGARVYHYRWQDNFAAAKNTAISYAKGSWLTFLDADEVIDHPELVRGMLAEYNHLYGETDVIIMTSVNVDADDGFREISRYPNMRIFRHKPGLLYSGRVHENLQYADGHQPASRYEERLSFRHTGYSTSVITGKIERNLALLQKEIAEKGEQPELFRYLADCYYALGDYRQAELYALRAIEAPFKGKGTHGDMYYMVLKCMRALREPAEEQFAFAQAAGRQFPYLPDFPAVMGICCQEAGQYEQGEKYLRQAADLASQHDGRESSSFGNIEALVYAKLADCQQHFSDWPAALENSRHALACNPYEEQALAVFCDLRQNDQEGLLAELKRYFADTEQDVAFLARFSERYGFGELYAHYRERLLNQYGKEMPRQAYYELLQAGEWQSLPDKLQKGLVDNLELALQLLLRLEQQPGKNYREAEQQLVDLLPVGVQQSWESYSQGKIPVDWQTYKTIWRYVLDYGDDAQIARFTNPALAQRDVWLVLVTDMLQQEKWQNAFAFLAQVPQQEADGLFWQNLGRCFYHLGQYPSAREAFDRARQAGQDNYLLTSYEHWLDEVI